MTQFLSSHLITATACGLLLPAFAAAWTPYGSSPYGNPSATAKPPAGLEAPAMPHPSMPGYANPPYGTDPRFPNAPYGFGPQMPGAGFIPEFWTPNYPEQFGTTAGPPRFFLSRSATSDAYVLDIRLENMEPTQIQVDIQGPWIRISSQNTREDVSEERFDDGRGFMRSYSYSSGSNSKRIPMPRDADPAAMTREDTADSVRITLPRQNP